MPEYMKTRPFGKPEGLAERLRDFVRALGTDKTRPWLGTGLVDDLNAAADIIDGKKSGGTPAKVEYDL